MLRTARTPLVYSPGRLHAFRAVRQWSVALTYSWARANNKMSPSRMLRWRWCGVGAGCS